jgi:uncharacterized membrane protein YbhN (UPF0104 family)
VTQTVEQNAVRARDRRQTAVGAPDPRQTAVGALDLRQVGTGVRGRRQPPVGVRGRRWIRPAAAGALFVLFAIELTVGWPALAGALRQLRAPHIGWLALVVLAELAAMSAYARMQRRLLHSAGVRSALRDHAKLAYAAHSLNETLPGGPAFSTRLNYQQMRRFGATPAVASWAIALSGIMSTTALAVITAGSALAAGGSTHWPRLVALLAVAALIAFGVRRLTAHPGAAEAVIRRPLTAFNRLRHRPPTETNAHIAGFLGQLRAARLGPADGLAGATHALLNWLLDATALWLCFYAVGEHPPTPTAVLLAFCAAMAAGSVTVVPGGLGIIDSALILGLVAGGTTLPVAVAVVVLYRIVSFGFIITLGWLFWLQLRATPGRPTPQPSSRPATTPSRSGPRTSPRRLGICPRHAHTAPASSTSPALASPLLASALLASPLLASASPTPPLLTSVPVTPPRQTPAPLTPSLPASASLQPVAAPAASRRSASVPAPPSPPASASASLRPASTSPTSLRPASAALQPPASSPPASSPRASSPPAF